MTPDIATIAAGLSEAQRRCGDVLDRLPCRHCGASTLRGCTVPMAEKAVASAVINDTPGLMNFLYLQEQAK
jgi:hypothetical protein